MENPICDFQIIQNPNRKYASTVNLVFFRAVPLTKNFQKYIDGLSNWKTYMKYYPDCQLQVFVDEHVLKEQKVQDLLKELNARVYVFRCPEYFIKDNFHIGLFGTMIRFYPMFDINTHPLKVAHIQELEPTEDSILAFESFHKFGNMKHGADMIYTTNKLYSKEYISNKYRFEEDIYYPWIIAGKFSAYSKIPFKLFSDFLNDVNKNKKFYNIYQDNSNKKTEHGNYSFGVDEIFLNDIYLGYLIDTHKVIGIFTKYKLSYPIYQFKHLIKKNSSLSVRIFEYILKKQGSLTELMADFDKLFYSNYNTERAIDCASRFYEAIEKYPNWLGNFTTKIILKFFKGFTKRYCLILIKNNKVIEIKDFK